MYEKLLLTEKCCKPCYSCRCGCRCIYIQLRFRNIFKENICIFLSKQSVVQKLKMTTKLQTLTELWQEFNLTGTQKLLDELATEITTKQDESDLSRKQLIDLIRNFKKSNSEEVRLIVAPLLKNFQNEIDMLSKRSKSAEKAFFDIYKKFCDIADPVPTLEYCMENMKNLQRLQDLEIENNQLRETMGDFNKEITDYKEKTKNLKEVEEKMTKLESTMQELVDKQVKNKEESLNSAFTEQLKTFEEEKGRECII